jgi:hypothetical protein
MNELNSRSNQAYGKGLQVATKSGNLKSIRVHNKSASTIYLQYFDSASTAAEGAVPSACPIPIVAGGYYESDSRFDFVSGLYACGSSTAATKTIIVADDLWITAQAAI